MYLYFDSLDVEVILDLETGEVRIHDTLNIDEDVYTTVLHDNFTYGISINGNFEHESANRMELDIGYSDSNNGQNLSGSSVIHGLGLVCIYQRTLSASPRMYYLGGEESLDFFSELFKFFYDRGIAFHNSWFLREYIKGNSCRETQNNNVVISGCRHPYRYKDGGDFDKILSHAVRYHSYDW
jgi:hypothetical protein